MSGLETAGLVLGIIPIIQLSIDSYKRNFSGSKKVMRQLGRSFSSSRLIYLNTIEEILSPVVSDSQLQELKRDPGGKAWQDPRLSKRLEDHLGEIYEEFKNIMADVKEMTDELEKLLLPPTDSVNADNRIKELKRYLSRSKGEVGLERLNRRLSDLETLKDQGQKLAVLRQEREARLNVMKNHASFSKGDLIPDKERLEAIRIYHKVGECARSLYSALSRGWHCECETPHHANLRLEARRPSRGDDTQGEETADKSEEDGSDEDLRFKFLFSYAIGQGGSASVDEQQPLAWREAEIAPFIHDPNAKPISSPQKHLAHRGQAATSSSSASADGRHLPETLGDPSQQIEAPDTSQKTELPRIRATRFVFEPKPSPPSHKQAKKTDIENVEELEIKDLCQLIRNIQNSPPDEDTCHGVLTDENDACYGLYSINTRKEIKVPLASIHIGDPLPPSRTNSGKRSRAKRPKLSRATRYEAAFTLGSTVLQLHSTPWLENWAKQDVIYLPGRCEGENPALLQPYISKYFSSSKLSDGANPESNVDGASHIWMANGTLLTLGILLIELAYGKPIEALAEAREETKIPIVTAQLVAKRLSKQISTEMGQLYQLAVAWCLSNDLSFYRSEPSLHSEEFQRSFLEHVIVPLQQSTDLFVAPSLANRK